MEKAAEVAAAADIDLDTLEDADEDGMASPNAEAEPEEDVAMDNVGTVDGASAAAQREGKLKHRPRTAHDPPQAAPLKTGVLFKRGAIKKNWLVFGQGQRSI